MKDNVSPEAMVCGALVAPPGPDVVRALAEVDVAGLPRAAVLDLLVGLERQIAWLNALQQQVVVSAVGAEPADDEDWGREEVAAALSLSGQAAAARIQVARSLTARLPGTLAGLAAGDLTYSKARAVAEATADLSDDAVATVESRVLKRAPEQSLAELRRSLRRAVAAADPVAFALAAQSAAEARMVRRWAEPDAMMTIAATLPALDAEIVWRALDARARATGGRGGSGRTGGAGGTGGTDSTESTGGSDSTGGTGGTYGSYGGPDDAADASGRRSLDQRRADALVELCRQALADPALPRAQGRSVEPQVVIDLPSLLGLSDDPAELRGYGPVPAEVARAVAGDSGWRRWVTDPVTGALLDYGRSTYSPPQALVDYVIARDPTCLFPGCNQPAHRADLDHRIPYESGGTTSAEQLHPLCRRHHLLKTHHGWRLEQNPHRANGGVGEADGGGEADGSGEVHVRGEALVEPDAGGDLYWVSPTGRTYPVRPNVPLPYRTPRGEAAA